MLLIYLEITVEVCEPGLASGDGQSLDGLLVAQLRRCLHLLQKVLPVGVLLLLLPLLLLLLDPTRRYHHLDVVLVLHVGPQVDVAIELCLALGTVPGGRLLLLALPVVAVLLAADHLDQARHGPLEEATGQGGRRHLGAVVAGHVLLKVARVLEGPVALLAHVGLAGVPIVHTVGCNREIDACINI